MADVRGYTAPHHWRRPRRGFLVAGSWDIDERLDLDGYYRESRNYRSTLQIFADGRPYRESDQYRHLHHSLLNGGRHNRAGSIEELERYFQKLHEIFENIRTRGFLSQRELNLATPTVMGEVQMMVDRDGHLLRAHGGNHRFAMAQVLDLEAIPVFVTGIHARWAQRCYERFGGDLVSAVQRGLDDLTVGRNARSRAA
jgi:hypothetical protein